MCPLALLPATGSMVNPKPDRLTLEDCSTTATGRFEEILRTTGRAGVNGSGGDTSSNPRVRSVGAGCGAMILSDNPNGKWIQE